jgi:photosystem II stability/assembly factor-like uncharacterized protein
MALAAPFLCLALVAVLPEEGGRARDKAPNPAAVSAVFPFALDRAPAPVWKEIGPSGGDVRSIAFNPAKPTDLRAVSKYGQVFQTSGAGTAWTLIAALEEELYGIAFAPGRPAVLYAQGPDALFRSEDGGRTWKRRPFPAGTSAAPAPLAVHPKSPDTVYVAGSVQSGSSKWMAVLKTADGGQAWSTAKLAATTARNGAARGVAIDSLSGSAVFVCGYYADTKKGHVFKSGDGGRIWKDVTGTVAGIPNHIAVDPAAPTKVYLATSQGFFLSRDGGGAWLGNVGDYFGPALGMSPSEPRVLYESSIAHTFRKSASDGMTWDAGRTGFDGTSRGFAVTPGRIRLSTSMGIIMSVDGGATWTENQEGIRATRIDALGLAPSSANCLYAATVDQGVLKTTNGGRTWALVWPVTRCASYPELSVHPKNPNDILVILESG